MVCCIGLFISIRISNFTSYMEMVVNSYGTILLTTVVIIDQHNYYVDFDVVPSFFNSLHVYCNKSIKNLSTGPRSGQLHDDVYPVHM